MSGTLLVFRPSLLRVFVVVSVSGLALTVAWYLVTSALVAQDVIPAILTAGTFAGAAGVVLATLWFVPKALRPIKVGSDTARIPGYLFRTTRLRADDVQFVWVQAAKSASEDFTPFIRTTDGRDIQLRLLAGATEQKAQAKARQFSAALGVEQRSGSFASQP